MMIMTIMTRASQVGDYLDKIISDPVCELNYNTDYELLIAIVLSAQTTDKRVNQVTKNLFSIYNSLEKLKKANVSDLEDILKSLGSFRKKASYVKEIATILVDDFDGIVPCNREVLESFPGVGRKTVSVFLSEFHDMPAFAVDTHVDRVSKRLGFALDTDNVLKVEDKMKEAYKMEEWGRRHKQFVLFGRYYCKAVRPLCDNCELKNICNVKKKI